MKLSLFKEIINTIKYWRYVENSTKISVRDKDIIELIRLRYVVNELVTERYKLIEKNETLQDQLINYYLQKGK